MCALGFLSVLSTRKSVKSGANSKRGRETPMMKRITLVHVVGLALVASCPASASIIFVGLDVIGGAGFGALPRALTIQSHGPSHNTESGCIAPDGSGGLLAGISACAPLGGDIGGDEQNPIGFPKQAAPSLSFLGITDANQIGILFDGIQPQNAGNNVVTINDLTLKLYNGATLVLTASGGFSNLATNPGNGNTDYLFALDDTEAAAFNAAIAGNFGYRIALDSTISFPNQSAGPDSYVLFNRCPDCGGGGGGGGGQAVPEPVSFLLAGSGLIGMYFIRRRQAKSR
jgi:PEP-CTERM motif